MKKRDVVALIRYHAEHNELGFKVAAYTVANCFEEMGDHELAHYVMSLVTDPNSFVPLFVPQSGSNDITDTIENQNTFKRYQLQRINLFFYLKSLQTTLQVSVMP